MHQGQDLNILIRWLNDESLISWAKIYEALATNLDISCHQ